MWNLWKTEAMCLFIYFTVTFFRWFPCGDLKSWSRQPRTLCVAGSNIRGDRGTVFKKFFIERAWKASISLFSVLRKLIFSTSPTRKNRKEGHTNRLAYRASHQLNPALVLNYPCEAIMRLLLHYFFIIIFSRVVFNCYFHLSCLSERAQRSSKSFIL